MVLYYILLDTCLYIYGTLPSSTGSLTIPMVLYYRLLASCLYIWYYTIFYRLSAYTYGTLLPTTGLLLIPMVLYYNLLAHCLSLWYSTIFYWPTACTYGTVLSSTGSLPIPLLSSNDNRGRQEVPTGTLLTVEMDEWYLPAPHLQKRQVRATYCYSVDRKGK